MWSLIKKQLKIIEAESGHVIKDWGGKTSVALVYPNTYHVGMSNLAVHTLYKLFNNDKRIVCERAFLPEKDEIDGNKRTNSPIISIETQRPLSEFDCLAFSISFQNDFLNVIPILSLCSIPHRKEKRNDSHPLIIAGGCAITLNPMPLFEIFDLFFIGECEEAMEDIIFLLSTRIPKKEKLEEFAKIKGVFVPYISKKETIKRFVKDINKWPTQTVIYTPNTEFSAMHLIEMSRGCPRNCKFCAEPCIYKPCRMRNFESIMTMIEEGLKHRKRIGLIGADLLKHPAFINIAKAINKRGAAFSPSSIRVDELEEEHIELLVQSGHKTVSLGIEAASEKLRASIGKAIRNEKIFEKISSLAAAGITSLRLYFMIGLPYETKEDIYQISKMAFEVLQIIRKSSPKMKRISSVSLSITPFVPKPLTAFERMPFADNDYLKNAIKILKKEVGKIKGISIKIEPVSFSIVDAVMSRGNSNLISFLEKYAESYSINKAMSQLSEDDIRHLKGGFLDGERLPWKEF